MAWRQCISSAIQKQEFVAQPTEESSTERCFLSAHRGASSAEVFTAGHPILITRAHVDHRDTSTSIFRDAIAHVGFDLCSLLRPGFDGRAAYGPCRQMLPVEHAPGRRPESFRATKVRPLLCNAAEGRRVQQ